MTRQITGSMLYDLIHCPHRPTMDVHTDIAIRDETSAFVKLLWEKGVLHEKEIIQRLEIPFLDLSEVPIEERETLTTEAMTNGEELIYSGRISADDLLGEPDLLRKKDNGYIAGDIKSGAGLEGTSEDLGKPKKHYGVQVALYTDILEKKGISAGREAFIWDLKGKEIIYDLDMALGPKTPTTLWDVYQGSLATARRIIIASNVTLPAYSSKCKMCHWYTTCQESLRKTDDLTLISELGRSKRDIMIDEIPSISHLVECNIEDHISGKKTNFPGIGIDTLKKFQRRAVLLKEKNSKPVIIADLSFPKSDKELFFDIEVDPFNDFCYLHGFVTRTNKDHTTEEYIHYYSDSLEPEEEKRIFSEAYTFIRDQNPCVIYYYSKYERTIWRKLQEKYPDICTPEEVEAIFNPEIAIDLYYDVVRPKTEWPTHDYSLKTLASYLGFQWRDVEPSGAASIEWFQRFIETNDPNIKKRILQYNEDDCRATLVLLDGIRNLQ